MCVFCKIVAGEIPSMKVYEDEHSLVFMDIAEDVDGHMLAVPKKHVKKALDYAFEPDFEDMDYDIHTFEKDDYDL